MEIGSLFTVTISKEAAFAWSSLGDAANDKFTLVERTFKPWSCRMQQGDNGEEVRFGLSPGTEDSSHLLLDTAYIETVVDPNGIQIYPPSESSQVRP